MKNIFLVASLLLFFVNSYGQVKVSYGGTRPTDTAYAARSARIDSTLVLIKYAGTDTTEYLTVDQNGKVIRKKLPAATLGGVTSVNGYGGVVILTTTDIDEGTNKYFTDVRVYNDSVVYLAWVKTLINQKLAYVDTLAMLAPYLRRGDSIFVYATKYGLDTGVKNTREWASATFQPVLGFTPENVANKVSDFSSPNTTTYPNTAAVNGLLVSYKLKSDSTATSGYVTHYQNDTAKAAIRAAIPSVTGLLSIDDSISVYATQHGQDTAVSNTRIWSWATFLTSYTETDPLSFHKVDSNTAGNATTLTYVAANYYPLSANPASYITAAAITGKVNFTDTAGMLAPYVRKADSNFNGGYETYKHAATTYQPIGTYITPSDTASMLSPYLSEQHASATYVAIVADTTISAAYTLTSRDFNRTIHCTNGSNIALTIPTGLGTTFVCVVLTEGAGTVTPTAGSTTLYYQPTSTTKIKSQGGATIRSWATANSYLIIGSLE